jgi:hypothetical protein
MISRARGGHMPCPSGHDMPGSRFVCAFALSLVFAVPAAAQTPNAKGGNGNGHKSKPPSKNPLPGPSAGASPLAWVDDASLLAPGTMSVTVSAMRWSGADLSEVDVPIVDASVGVTTRFQIGASVPHVIGSADGTGAVGGIGTSYITSKIGLLTDAEVKLAVAPIVEILGEGAVQSLSPGASRVQVGVPVSLEIGQGPARVFAATGVFSRGAWFAGGGASLQTSPRTSVSLSFNRAWARTDVDGVTRDRRELSGGVSYFARPQLGLFASVGHTIATTDDNGAGLTVSGGVSVVMHPRVVQ